MGSITVRKRKDGSVAYLAQVTIKSEGKIVHREARTFDREPIAKAWMKKVEKEAKTTEGLATLKRPSSTLADAIDQYFKDSGDVIGRTKTQTLRTIKKEYAIADMDCAEIRSADIVAFAKELSARMLPQTASVYLSNLSTIFAIAKPAWNMALDYREMEEAFQVCKRLKLVTPSDQRERRPTIAELDKILTHFQKQIELGQLDTPMVQIICFALFSTRRQEEITLIRWDDLEKEHNRVLVRNMKNPGQKRGNNVWCDLPPEAMAIIDAMPETDERIFPFNPRSVGASFTRTCQFLEVEDLHFHDLRHEGISRLFELGWNIPHVASVSGHRSWGSLKRYTHIRGKGDKYEGWAWKTTSAQPLKTEEEN